MSLVALIEAKPRDPATGAVSTLRLVCNARERANFMGVQWLPALLTLPASETVLGFDGEGFGAGATPTVSEIVFGTADGLQAWAAKLWRSAEVKLWLAAWPAGHADPADGAFVVAFTGRADELAVDAGGKARLTILDPGQALRAAVTTRTFGQSGDTLLDSADAVRAQKGQAVPVGWGELIKKPGRLVDQANLVYLFAGNAATSVQGFFDGGAPFTIGAARASLAALRANIPAEGAVDYCLSAGGLFLARPWSTPVYPFTADFTCGSVKPADIAAAIVASRTTLAFKAGAVAAFNAVEDGPAQFYVDNDETTLAEALDQLFSGLGAWWKLTAAGAIDARRWSFAASVKTFAAWQVVSLERTRLIMPTAKRTLGFAKLGKVHSDGEIAKGIDYSNITGNKPGSDATNANNLQLNPLLTDGTDGYNLTSGWMARAAGQAGPPAPWVLSTTAATSGGNPALFPKSKVAGGRRVICSIWVLRTATLSTLTLAANAFQALNAAAGIGPVGAAISIVPATANIWQRFSVSGLNYTDAGFIELTVENMTGNAGIVQVAIGEISYDLGADGNAVLEVPPDVTIKADYTGAVLSGQLPRTVQGTRRKGTSDVSASTTWAATSFTGITASIDADGTVTISACDTTGKISWETMRDGVVLKAETKIDKQRAAVPATTGGGAGTGGGSGGSGSPASDSSIDPTAATTYGAANAGPLIVVVGSSGTVNLTAPLEFYSSGTAISARGKWQWRLSGGTFADVAGEVIQSVNFNAGTGDPGYIAVNQSKTGLTSGSTYEFVLLLRKPSGSGQLDFAGDATATPT